MLGRLSPVPNPVTQISRLTPARSMVVTTIPVACEKRLTGPSTMSGEAGTPSVRMTAATPGEGCRNIGAVQRAAVDLLEVVVAELHRPGRSGHCANEVVPAERLLCRFQPDALACPDDKNPIHVHRPLGHSAKASSGPSRTPATLARSKVLRRSNRAKASSAPAGDQKALQIGAASFLSESGIEAHTRFELPVKSRNDVARDGDPATPTKAPSLRGLLPRSIRGAACRISA